MAKASVLTIRIPADLKHRIDLLAEEQGVSINQLAMYMFAKEIGNIESSQHISKYWKGYTKKEIEKDFDEIMNKIENRPVPKWDKLE
jgi:antitoxin component of RelBE/YafQ-DinJ toxin-antitoxin module